MVEKVGILKHHYLEIISCLIPTGRKKTYEVVDNYINETLYPPRYRFTKESKERMSGAIQQATTAVLEDNFRVIPDFRDREETIENFDLICLNCPNHNAEEEKCKLEQKRCLAKK